MKMLCFRLNLKQRISSNGFKKKLQKSEEIAMIDNPNIIHAFNHFEEGDRVERFKCRFRVIDLTRDAW